MAKPFETLECGRVINPYKTKTMPKQNQPFLGSTKSGVYDYVARRYILTNCPENLTDPCLNKIFLTLWLYENYTQEDSCLIYFINADIFVAFFN